MIAYEQPKLPDPLPSWYQRDVTEDIVSPEAKQILEQYSKLKPDEVLPHVLRIRDRGFAINPYPCVGQIRFLDSQMDRMFYWPEFRAALSRGATLLDAGCGLGQSLRHLVQRHGVPASQLYGFDLEPSFIELGYDLFRDRPAVPEAGAAGEPRMTLFAADMLSDPPAPQLQELEGAVDLVHCAQFLHVFDYEEQLAAAGRLVRLTRPRQGSMIAGHQMGSRNPGSYKMPTITGGTGRNYRHNPESMKLFWDTVGERTGTKWHVECTEIESKATAQNKDADWAKVDPGICMIAFSAKRE